MSFVPNCDLKRLDPMSNDYFLSINIDIFLRIEYTSSAMAPSTSGLSLSPLKAAFTGSNPVGVTSILNNKGLI